MRLWLDPRKLNLYASRSKRSSTPSRTRTPKLSPGQIGVPATNGKQPFQYSIRAFGQLTTPKQFENIVLTSTPAGRAEFHLDRTRVSVDYLRMSL
jgi:hypothetical protein